MNITVIIISNPARDKFHNHIVERTFRTFGEEEMQRRSEEFAKGNFAELSDPKIVLSTVGIDDNVRYK